MGSAAVVRAEKAVKCGDGAVKAVKTVKTVKVRDMIIGEGAPKICVPIVGETREDILDEARLIAASQADIAEFRADYYEGLSDPESLAGILRELREILGNMPLLMTLRTKEEGGFGAVSTSEYSDINIRAARSGLVDLIDLELGRGSGIVMDIIEKVHAAGAAVIVSSHDFDGTPPGSEIVERLCRMQDAGADIVKIAVMPGSRRDVITLLAALDEMLAEYAKCPVIAISMGETGMITRIAAEAFGSSVSFGCASRASAPGQIGADELKALTAAIHDTLS